MRPTGTIHHRTATTLALATVTAAALVGCSLVGEAEPDGSGGSDGSGDGATGGVVRVVTHDSFSLPQDLIAQFEADTGYTIEQSAPGDGGALVNQLILTKDAPLGDVAYGVDNTFASRALAEDVFAPREGALPAAAEQYVLPEDSGGALAPVDIGDVCFNIDRAWFAVRGVPEPETFEDLLDPAYADLTVVPDPSTSSPGLAMLVASVGALGEDGYADYWSALADNGLRVVSSWSDAYYVDFSGSGGEGARPITLSYSTSPAFEVAEGEDEARTTALLNTCFRQVEYAGVLAGAENPEGAAAFVEFLLSEPVQEALPESMFVYPVDDTVALPQAWVEFAPLAPSPIEVSPGAIDAGRETWIDTFTEAVGG